VLIIASASPADARSHRRGRHHGKPAAQVVQDDKSSSLDKASAVTDEAMDKNIKSICRGC